MRAPVFFVIALLCVGYLGLDWVWLAADEGIQTTDAAYHFSRVASLRGGLLGTEQGSGFDGQRYGGLVYYLAALLSMLVGLEPPRLLFALAVLLRPLLVVGLYRLGWELAVPDRRQQTGVLAACLGLMLPGFVNYGRVLVLDLPLTVAITWAAVFALSAAREDLGGSITRTTRMGLISTVLAALLIKLNALAFLAGPLWVLARPRLRALPTRTLLLRLVGAAAAVGGLAAVLLASARGSALRRTLVEATWPGALVFGYLPQGSAATFLPDWLGLSVQHTWEAAYYTWLQTLSPPWCVLGLAAFVWFFSRRHGCEDPVGHIQRDAAFWWFIVPAIGVTFGLRGLYDERYVLPLLPLVAGILATAAMDVPRPWLRRAVIAIALLGGALNHGFIHHDVWPTARPLVCADVPGWTTSERVGDSLWTCLAYPEYSFMDRPATPWDPDLPVADIDDILEVIADGGAPLKAVFLDDLYDVFYALWQSSLMADRPVLRHEDMLLLTDCWDEARMTAVFESRAEVDRQISQSHVVIMRFGVPHGESGVRGRRCAVFWDQQSWFEVAGDVPLSDGTSVRVYRNTRR